MSNHQYWFRLWLVTYPLPSHCLNQCCFIFNGTLRNKLQWNFNQNTKLFIHENASENIVCEMASILSKERWVNGSRPLFFSGSGMFTGMGFYQPYIGASIFSHEVTVQVNSLSPGRCDSDFKCINFKHNLIKVWCLEYSGRHCTGMDAWGSCWW